MSSREKDLLWIGIYTALLPVTLVVVPLCGVLWLMYGVGRLIYLIATGNTMFEFRARRQTMKLYNEVKKKAVSYPSADAVAAKIVTDLDVPEGIKDTAFTVLRDLYAEERMFDPLLEPPPVLDSIEGGKYRDYLSKYAEVQVHHLALLGAWVETAQKAITILVSGIPRGSGGLIAWKDLEAEKIGDLQELFLLDEDLGHFGVFYNLRKALERNLLEASNLTHETWEPGKIVDPTQYQGPDMPMAYLKGTPLADFCKIPVRLSIPEDVKYEGQWIVAPPGTGKTQFIQYQVAQLLKRVPDVSVIVMDSQEQMIDTISHLKLFAGFDRLVVVDANDVLFPVSLNLFDLGAEEDLSPLETERRLNTALELTTFMFESLLGSDLTSKQAVVFRFLVQAMFAIPNATIHTFRELLEPGGRQRFRDYLDRLDGAAGQFFDTQFDAPQFRATREEVIRRLYGILGIRAWERMFSQPTTKLDLFAEMNDGKVILINTAKSLLQQKGCEVFGRFFLALIAMAAQKRATMRGYKIPVHVFIDELHDYASDANISLILEQCRKQNIALTVAHQNTSQLSQRTLDSLQGCAIKCASSLTDRDANILARGMRTKPQFLEHMRRGEFAIHVRNVTDTAVKVDVPFGLLESIPRMTDTEYQDLMDENRERIAVPAEPEPVPEPVVNEPPKKRAFRDMSQSGDAW